jgi:hypothetical protein
MESFKDMSLNEELELKTSEDVTKATKPKNSELNELKNIRYKTSAKMDLSGTDINNLDLFLENEKSTNQGETWTKLDKTTKYKKLADFVDVYSVEKSLTEKEKQELIVFLKDAVDKKKIYKVKDIIYDKVNNLIKEIPGLVFLKSEHKNFTLRNATKMTTLKSMPKKKPVPIAII